MTQRIAVIDGARGMAILGILLMNICSFALPQAAYLNPAYNGTVSFPDALTWVAMMFFVQGKFIAIFALLFGAGLMMLSSRGATWIRWRLFWLMIFGIIHGVFFWYGDILFSYGLIGLLVSPLLLTNDKPGSLFRQGVLFYSVALISLLLFQLAFSDAVPLSFWSPDSKVIEAETAWKLKGGVMMWKQHFALLGNMFFSLTVQYGWQLAGLMFVGAALMKSGWLTGSYSQHHYRKAALILIPLALCIQSPGVIAAVLSDWDSQWSLYFVALFREMGAPLQAIGYLALWYGYWSVIQRTWFSRSLSAIGRMALSCYLLQTLICTFFFYRLGFYQAFDRVTLLLIVPVIWLLIMLFSRVWLYYFARGPVEWLWSRLTRWSSARYLV